MTCFCWGPDDNHYTSASVGPSVWHRGPFEVLYGSAVTSVTSVLDFWSTRDAVSATADVGNVRLVCFLGSWHCGASVQLSTYSRIQCGSNLNTSSVSNFCHLWFFSLSVKLNSCTTMPGAEETTQMYIHMHYLQVLLQTQYFQFFKNPALTSQ